MQCADTASARSRLLDSRRAVTSGWDMGLAGPSRAEPGAEREGARRLKRTPHSRVWPARVPPPEGRFAGRSSRKDDWK